MGKINFTRVLLGGLLAGLVINIGEFILNELILKDTWTEFMKESGMEEQGAGVMAFYLTYGFVLGIVMVWIYAAIRPRFGAVVMTGIISGLITWILLWVLGFGSMIVMDLLPRNAIIISVVWGLFEAPLAAVAGAWVYKEGGGEAAAPTAEAAN